MIEYIIGFISALISIKIIRIINEYLLRKRTKEFVYEVHNQEELDKALNEIFKEMDNDLRKIREEDK